MLNMILYNKSNQLSFVKLFICCIQISLFCLVSATEELHDGDKCSHQLVQTIPEGMTFRENLPFEIATTPEVFVNLINKAKSSIRITTFELTLLRVSTQVSGTHPSMAAGELIVEALEEATKRGVQVEIITGLKVGQEEEARLVGAGMRVRYFDVTKYIGSGVQHSKMLIIDDASFYLGSSNWDWLALAHVKEMGIVFNDCHELASDLIRIFKTWSMILDEDKVPKELPAELIAKYNDSKPLTLNMDNITTNVYLAASPKYFVGTNNPITDDLDALLRVIGEAEKHVDISVMDFSTSMFKSKGYWSVLETALKKAMYEKGVRVRLLVSKKPGKFIYQNNMNELLALNQFRENRGVGSIEVKVYSVPIFDQFQASLPYARLKHDKYVVSDKAVYFGTSNFGPDYFMYSTGVSMVVRPDPIEAEKHERNIINDMSAIFDRDYFSQYSTLITEFKNER